jgi:hypothetical protein
MRQDQGRSWDAFSHDKHNYSFICNNWMTVFVVLIIFLVILRAQYEQKKVTRLGIFIQKLIL